MIAIKDHQDEVVKEQHHNGGMQHLAEQVEEHYTRPLPKAEWPTIEPFPAVLIWGLGLGAVTGGVLGWTFGRLLLDGTVVIPGAEGLFSMFPYAFQVFWIGIGLAVGLAIGGIGAILAVPATRHHAASPESEP